MALAPSPPIIVQFSKVTEFRSLAEYKAIYNWSAADPEGFWSEIAIIWNDKYSRWVLPIGLFTAKQ
jgi:hypothetical protein